jgi:hypothetical protein
MERHPADLFSLLTGLLILGLGLLLLSGGVSEVPMEWVGPAVAVGVGILIVVAARPSRDSNEDAAVTADES